MSFRAWISLATVVLLGLIIYMSQHEIAHAWRLMSSVNLWILALLLPGQALVYFANGEMIFSYLRSKGSIHHLNGPTLGRMSLEVNFVNHVLPSGGVSGISYLNWRLKRYGVSTSRATMAQVVRFAAGFVAFIILLFAAVVIVTLDSGINRWVIMLSGLLVGLLTTAIVLSIFLLSQKRRTDRFAIWTHHAVNLVVRKLTFGRKKEFLDREPVQMFFDGMHDDYLGLVKDKRVLLRPLLWGLLFTAGEAGLFMITFWALDVTVNPAVVLIAYGLSSLVGFFVVTPGGAGAYEAIMISFLAIAGVPSEIAIAGTLLTRVILLLGTIGFGYVFYQHAILRYGKTNNELPPPFR